MSSAEEASVLDHEVLEQLRSIGDEAFFADLIDLYTSDALPRIEEIRQAGTRGDAAHVATEAHALKSSSGNVGAAAMRDLCAAIESAARDGEISADIRRLEHEYARAVAALRQIAESM